MSQNEYYRRPPSEADSFIIRVMDGCPHNKCTFCDSYRAVKCRVLPIAQVLGGIKKDSEDLGTSLRPLVTSMYLEGGDPMFIDTDYLMTVMSYAASVFPELQRFACYATARSVINKKRHELAELSGAGLRRVFVGLESGSDKILRLTNKGCTSVDLALAGKMLTEAGIEMDVSIMLGIGGAEFTKEHAEKTAQLLNNISPVCVRIRTFTPKPGTELGEDWQSGRFTVLEPHDILRELRMMVGSITGTMQLLSEHWTNFIHFNALMPDAKDKVLSHIDYCLTLPRSSFRATGLTYAEPK